MLDYQVTGHSVYWFLQVVTCERRGLCAAHAIAGNFCHRQKPLDVRVLDNWKIFKIPPKLDVLYLKTTLQHLILGFRKTFTLENMDLILSDHHPWTAIYSTASGEKSGTPIFTTDTGKGNKKHTTIRGSLGAPGGMNEMGIPIAEIDFKGLFSSDVLTLRGRELRVVNRGFMWRSVCVVWMIDDWITDTASTGPWSSKPQMVASTSGNWKGEEISMQVQLKLNGEDSLRWNDTTLYSSYSKTAWLRFFLVVQIASFPPRNRLHLWFILKGFQWWKISSQRWCMLRDVGGWLKILQEILLGDALIYAKGNNVYDYIYLISVQKWGRPDSVQCKKLRRFELPSLCLRCMSITNNQFSLNGISTNMSSY